MPRFLVLKDSMEISGVFDDNHVFGAMEDIEQYEIKYGSREGYPDDFVIIDIRGITMQIARDLTGEVISTIYGEIDPLTGEPHRFDIIDFKSNAVFDFNEMAITAQMETRLANDRKVLINAGQLVRRHITERAPTKVLNLPETSGG